jgi:hypothetical protein
VQWEASRDVPAAGPVGGDIARVSGASPDNAMLITDYIRRARGFSDMLSPNYRM